MNNFLRYKIQIGLVIIIVVLMWIKLNFGYSKETKIENIEVEETLVTEEIEREEIDPNYPLWDKLPYSGKGFVVDRYVEPLTLVVKVKGIDKEIVEEEVLDWLESQEVATDSHELVWE